MKGIGYK